MSNPASQRTSGLDTRKRVSFGSKGRAKIPMSLYVRDKALFTGESLKSNGSLRCGLVKKGHARAHESILPRIDGTSLDRIKSDKTPDSETTGYKGAYFI